MTWVVVNLWRPLAIFFQELQSCDITKTAWSFQRWYMGLTGYDAGTSGPSSGIRHKAVSSSFYLTEVPIKSRK